MPSYQTTSTLTRTRPPRASAKPTLTAPPTLISAPAAQASISSSTSGLPLGTPLNKPPQIPTCTSNVLLFLTNLRLLDLDINPDWPDITPTTFSAKDAAGGQRKRIQCVEWALYQLFSLWDPNDAQNKLRPFFPPTDQVQSTNLRAALIRSLEAIKKIGILGRDVIIRKTMLDECKGERLEEVLAVFSSAVLKKLVAERALNSGPAHRPTISENISLENWGYTGDRTELNGLLLAHKASLKLILEEKRTAREKYYDFKQLLDLKERGIARRQAQAESSAQDRPTGASDTSKAEVRRLLRNNWAGNEQWIDGLLGDSSFQKGGLLSTPFDDVWSGVQAGNVTDLEEQTTGLLEQLEERVHHHKARLQKWADFRKSTFGDIRPKVARESSPRKKKQNTQLDLTAHFSLDFNKFASTPHSKSDAPPPEYANLIGKLKSELGGFKKTKIPDFSGLKTSTRGRPTSMISSQLIPQEHVEDPVSDLSDWGDEPEGAAPHVKLEGTSTKGNTRPTVVSQGFVASRRQLSGSHENRKARGIDDPVESLGGLKRSRTDACSSHVKHRPDSTKVNEPKRISRSDPNDVLHPVMDKPRPTVRAINTMPPPPRPKSPTQLLADEILNSMSNASPSPMKKPRHTLSLDERTRLSMARTTSFDLENETPQTSPVKESNSLFSDDLLANNELERGEEYDDLMTRTRRSMAGFEAARQKAQVERRRSQRNSKMAQKKDSYFSKVDEEATGDLSVAEGLMEDSQEDYEAIFKSRPRIATSPAPSPSKQGYEMA